MLPTPPGSSLCGHTVSSRLSGLSVSLLASVCCLLLSLSLLSPYVTCLSSYLWGAEFLSRALSRPAMPNHRILFSRFLKSLNTRATPGKYLPTMIFPPIGQSLEFPGKPIGSCISVWIQFASSSTPFPSPPFANNAVVWTHHTRSSKPSYIWCIRRIWPD